MVMMVHIINIFVLAIIPNIFVLAIEISYKEITDEVIDGSSTDLGQKI